MKRTVSALQRALQCTLLAMAVLCAAASAAEPTVRSGDYDITAETVMPHLEENLRYATIRERRCLRDGELPAFPVLQHPSLHGCQLTDESRSGRTLHYRLVCTNPQVAAGMARLEATSDHIVGVLEIKMGGKNMTFSQRIAAARRGPCTAGPPIRHEAAPAKG